MLVLSIAEMSKNQELFLSCYQFETVNECHLKVVEYCKNILNQFEDEILNESFDSIRLEICAYREQLLELNYEIEFEITEVEHDSLYILK